MKLAQDPTGHKNIVETKELSISEPIKNKTHNSEPVFESKKLANARKPRYQH